MSLTDKQKRFVEQYLVDLNATQAAVRAGYSERTACEQGSRLLANVKVRAAIEAAQGKRSERTAITADMVLKEFARIAFADLRLSSTWTESALTLIPSDDLDDDAAAAISEVSIKEISGNMSNSKTVKIKHHDKVRALEFLAEHLGMVRRKVDVKVELGKLSDDELLKIANDAAETLRKAK